MFYIITPFAFLSDCYYNKPTPPRTILKGVMPLNTETTLNILVEIFSILSSVIALMIRVIAVMQSIITVLLADTMVSIYAGAFGRSIEYNNYR